MASRVLLSRLRSHLFPFLRPTTVAPLHRLPLPSSPPPDLFLRQLQPDAGALLRCLSTFSAGRRAPSRHVDVGARARQLQSRRLWTYALTFSCVAGFVVIVLSQFQDQLVFYVTPTDALEKFAANPAKNRFRLGGLVVEGSFVHPSNTSPEMEFVITDLVTDILVRYEGALPDLFREGHSAVVEGFVKPFGDENKAALSGGSGGRKVSEKARSGECFFEAVEVLAKHDEKYMPKEVAEALERNKKKLEAEAAADAEEKKS